MNLTIYNRTYSLSELPSLAKEKCAEQLSAWETALFNFLDNWFDDTDFIQAHSSGSTGEPKVIKLSKKQMIASAALTNDFFQLTADDKILLCLSVNYIAGKMMVVRALTGNLHLIAQEPCSCPIVEEPIRLAAMVPMQVERMLSCSTGTESLNLISSLIIGGSAILKNTEEKLQRISTECYATYGMTETVSHVALRWINGSEQSTEYKALNGIKFAQDKRDCLIIYAPHLQETAFITNDIVKLLSSTSFEWIGRYDNVINSGGIKFFPENLEAKITNLLNNRFFIGSLPDDNLGQKIVLAIEGEVKSDTEIDELKNKLSSRLNRYEMPKEIIFIPHFLETESGKVKRIICQQ